MAFNYNLCKIISKDLTSDNLYCYKDKIRLEGPFSWTYHCVFYKDKHSSLLEEVNEESTILHNPLPNLADKLIEKAIFLESNLIDKLFRTGNTIAMNIVTGDFSKEKFDNFGINYVIKPFKKKELKKFKELIFQKGNSKKYINKIIEKKKEYS